MSISREKQLTQNNKAKETKRRTEKTKKGKWGRGGGGRGGGAGEGGGGGGGGGYSQEIDIQGFPLGRNLEIHGAPII